MNEETHVTDLVTQTANELGLPQEQLQEILERLSSEKKSVSQSAIEQFEACTIIGATTDKEFTDEAIESKKQEMRFSQEAKVKNEQAESRSAEEKLQQADYGVFRGVATYAGIKKPLPNKMQRIVFSGLCVWQTLLLLIFGFFTSTVTIIADSADAIMQKVSSISKSARVFVISVFIVVAVGTVLYIGITFFKNKLGVA